MRSFRIIFLLAIGAYLLSMVHRAAPVAIAAQLQAAFSINATQLGLLAAMYFYVYTVMQIPVGLLADSFGPRMILSLGGVLAALGSVMLGVSADFSAALIARVIVGLGVSVTFIAALKIIALGYPESHFARMTGWVHFVGNLGAAFVGLPLTYLSVSLGWRAIFVILGVLSFVIALLSYWKIPTLPRTTSRLSLSILWREMIRPVVANRATWPGFFANLGLAGAHFSFAGLWAAPYFTQYFGYSKNQVGSLISIYFVGFAVGAVLWGQLSDRIKKRRIVLRSGAFLHVAAWWVLAANVIPVDATYSFLAIVILCAVLGISAASFTLHWACAKEVNPPQLSGMATSVVNVGIFLGVALQQPLIGWIVELSWNGQVIEGVRYYSATDWQHGIVALTLAVTLGALSALLIRETNCQNRWSENAEKSA